MRLLFVLPLAAASEQWPRPSGWLPGSLWTTPQQSCRRMYISAATMVWGEHTTGCMASDATRPQPQFSASSAKSCATQCLLHHSGVTLRSYSEAMSRPDALAVVGGSDHHGCFGTFTHSGMNRWIKAGTHDPDGLDPVGGRRVLYHDGVRYRCDATESTTPRDWLCSEPTNGAPGAALNWFSTCGAAESDPAACVSDSDGQCRALLSVGVIYEQAVSRCWCSLNEIKTGPAPEGGCESIVMQLPVGCQYVDEEDCSGHCAVASGGCCVDALGHAVGGEHLHGWWIVVIVCCLCAIVALVFVFVGRLIRSPEAPPDQVARIAPRLSARQLRQQRRSHLYASVAAVMSQVPFEKSADENCPICLESGQVGDSSLRAADKARLQHARQVLVTSTTGEPFGCGEDEAGLPEALLVDLGPEAERGWGLLGCGHRVHRMCLEKWFLQQVRGSARVQPADPTCPICRAVLPDLVSAVELLGHSGRAEGGEPPAEPQADVHSAADVLSPAEVPSPVDRPQSPPSGRDSHSVVVDVPAPAEQDASSPVQTALSPLTPEP
eukprot:TRINITY_DN232_c0_g3_i1.p1 TRINITY_DN232_c0_g3~~TRINITY_DN232_c0_g3_i1.p1  ORF type:complete len:550 (+),score=90.91 TRINITY_DN232_c0_g3_i1:63-1712(+)